MMCRISLEGVRMMILTLVDLAGLLLMCEEGKSKLNTALTDKSYMTRQNKLEKSSVCVICAKK